MKKLLTFVAFAQLFVIGAVAQDINQVAPANETQVQHHHGMSGMSRGMMPGGGFGFGFGFGDASAISILPVDQMPKAETYLQEYPRPGDALFYNDSVQYEIGKALRDTPRGQLAVEDASTSLNHYLKRFGEVMGFPEMNSADFPAMAALVNSTLTSARQSIQSTKDYFKRERPYSYFKQQSATPREERPNDLTSYPSGHAVRAWAIALALVGVDPEHQNEILQIGYDLCYSRVIVGFHYQSDIEAARVAASAAFARICTEQTWVDQFKAAKDEIAAKRSAVDQ